MTPEQARDLTSPPTDWLRSSVPPVSGGMVTAIGLLVVASGVLLLVTADPLIAAAPLVLVLTIIAVMTLPVRVPLVALIFLAGIADVAQLTLPSGKIWTPPQFALNPWLFDNLNKVLPIEALRFSLVDLLYITLMAVALARVAFRIRVDTVGRLSGTNALYVTLGFAFLGAVWLLAWGVGVRGGNFKQSLWQMRQLFWLPVVTGLFAYSLRDARDFHAAVNAMIAASCVKIAISVYFYFTIARPESFQPHTMTSHYDSILYIVSLIALLVRVLHAPSLKSVTLAGTLGGFILLGVVLNNRRLAFVNLLVCLFVIFLMYRGPAKRLLVRGLIMSLPFIAAYAVIGRNSSKTIFKPAKLIMSVVSQEDRSSDTRDIENFNLLVTMKQNKLLGSGWGHEYIELVKADDISQIFAQYRYIAHNSILWLFSIGGMVGFTLIWMPLMLGIFLARRAYDFVRSAEERSACELAISMLVIYVMQAWGDLGTQGLISTLTAGLAMATAAKLAVGSGAFGARVRFFGKRRDSFNTPETVVIGV